MTPQRLLRIYTAGSTMMSALGLPLHNYCASNRT